MSSLKEWHADDVRFESKSGKRNFTKIEKACAFQKMAALPDSKFEKSRL